MLLTLGDKYVIIVIMDVNDTGQKKAGRIQKTCGKFINEPAKGKLFHRKTFFSYKYSTRPAYSSARQPPNRKL
jgi:hypothetical protein